MTRQQRHREARREFWRRTLADWARSGMSKSDYARLHGLEPGKLRLWSSHYPHWARRGQASEKESSDTGAEETEAASTPAQRFVTLRPEGEEGETELPATNSEADPSGAEP
ncbi:MULTISPECIES: IS66 family insertion sequence element accessory protein TnpA, partial [unclassified Halorhodospira]|uniref:IS66 family insertion sequence element accessory protein TnpA n=1 Tax=unclassified Halorhodospira TaxID=2626748 RepID=UPI001EE985E7